MNIPGEKREVAEVRVNRSADCEMEKMEFLESELKSMKNGEKGQIKQEFESKNSEEKGEKEEND